MAHRDYIVAPLAALLPLAGCDTRELTVPHDTRDETLARLEKITSGCGLPSETLSLIGSDQVTVAVRPDVDYRKVDCLLEALRKTEPRLKLGFIGNEAYGTGNQR